jgi:hypothetical protein
MQRSDQRGKPCQKDEDMIFLTLLFSVSPFVPRVKVIGVRENTAESRLCCYDSASIHSNAFCPLLLYFFSFLMLFPFCPPVKPFYFRILLILVCSVLFLSSSDKFCSALAKQICFFSTSLFLLCNLTQRHFFQTPYLFEPVKRPKTPVDSWGHTHELARE